MHSRDFTPMIYTAEMEVGNSVDIEISMAEQVKLILTTMLILLVTWVFPTLHNSSSLHHLTRHHELMADND